MQQTVVAPVGVTLPLGREVDATPEQLPCRIVGL
jgi:hypothetical protein